MIEDIYGNTQSETITVEVIGESYFNPSSILYGLITTYLNVHRARTTDQSGEGHSLR
jgi:hypothetical protein